MRSKPYLDTLINEVKEQVQAIQTTDDFLTFYQWIKGHDEVITLLQSLDNLPLPLQLTLTQPQSNITSVVTTDKPPVIEATVSEKHVHVTTVEPISKTSNGIANEQDVVGRVFPFVKKALGGSIEELGFHLNEDIVRRHQIEHGNLIKIMGIEGRFPDGSPRYSIDVIEHTAKEHESLKSVSQGIIEFLFGKFLIRRTTSQSIKLNGEEITLFIQERDVEKHQLKEGDIIDGRFYENSLESFRVTYKFPMGNGSEDRSIEGSRLASRRKFKKENNTSSFSMLDRLDISRLEDKSILIVGLASRTKDFQQTLANYPQLKVTHLTGDERDTQLRNAITEADVVLVNITENSHHATKLTTALCKELNVPIKSTSADGLYMLLHTAKEFLDKLTDTKQSQVM